MGAYACNCVAQGSEPEVRSLMSLLPLHIRLKVNNLNCLKNKVKLDSCLPALVQAEPEKNLN